MLVKLFKYELKSTARWFIPLYVALVLFTLINRILLYKDQYFLEEVSNFRKIAGILSMSVYVFLFVGIMAVSFVVVIQRFYKNLLGNEGYLMFTLPVQTWKHIMSKLLIAMLWNLSSAVIGIGSIIFLLPSDELGELGLLFYNIKEYLGTMGYFSISLLLLTSLAFSITEMYTAIALGHLFRKHKLLASFGMYIGLYAVSQIIFAMVIPFFLGSILPLSEPMPFTSGRLNMLIMMLLSSSFSVRFSAPRWYNLNILILTACIIFILFTAACYISTNIILKRRLNLE